MGIFFLVCIIVVIGVGVYAIKAVANQAKNSTAEISNDKEYKRQCRTCGAVFCFTDRDLEISKANQTLASLRTFKSITAGSSYHKYEERKAADSALSKVVHYDKCPKCNSTDLIDITDGNVGEKRESSDNIEQLKKFKELLDAGIISQEEFDEQKNKVLNR